MAEGDHRGGHGGVLGTVSRSRTNERSIFTVEIGRRTRWLRDE